MRSRLTVSLSLVVALLLLLGPPAAVPAGAQQSMTSAGPLTSITVSPDLNCAVNHVDDSVGEFYAETACGTFVSLDGVLYGPAHIPAGSALGSYTPYVAAGQSSGGSGTVADPFRITTTVTLGDSGVQLTQVDSYVAGQAAYRTDVTLVNNSSASHSGYVYRAADCYLANSDSGLGVIGADGRVGCTNQTRAEEFIPITGNSTYLEAGYSQVWAAVGAQQPLSNTCRCEENIDNGMALAWNVTVVGGSQATVSSSTSFGTSASTVSQIDVESASYNPSRDEQGRNVFSVSRGSSADLTITIRPEPEPGCTILQVSMTHRGLQYAMTDPEGDGTYTGTIPRSQLGEADITYTVETDCGTTVGSIGRVVLYDPSGVVTDATTGQTVPGASVTLFNVPSWRAQTPGDTGPQTCETTETRGPDGWTQPAPTAEGVIAVTSAGTFTPDVNPQLTGPDGRYGWDVATGCWYVTVQAQGYAALTSPVVGVPPEVTDLDLVLTPTGGQVPTGASRLAGPERIATAIAVSQDMWLDGGAAAVMLARHDNFPDSLAGGPLAVAMGGPLLLTPSDGLWPDTAAEIMRVLPAGGSVVLLGGVAALSEDVAMDLFELGYAVYRADGATRYETSVILARATSEAPVTILVADGNTFADALLASSAAPAAMATVVLTAGTTLPDVVADYLDGNNAARWVTVGPAAGAALPNADAHFEGADSYATSTLIADEFWPGARGFAVASGENFPDALAGSAHSARLGYPLLLSRQAAMTQPVLDWLAANGPFSDMVLYGGTAALSDTVLQQASSHLM